MNIKRLVLGTAAGALAVTGAQAADLPVVVEPIDYVRICDAFGTGFYYLPGTETCLKVGGRIRTDYNLYFDLEDGDGFQENWGFQNDTRGYRFRARGYIRLDSRTATEFGLLRTYLDAFGTYDSSARGNGAVLSAFEPDTAIIQFGGLTFGRVGTFFGYGAGIYTPEQTFDIGNNTGNVNLIGYTAAFGNGFSVSVALEDTSDHRDGIVDFLGGAARYAGTYVPDVVGNIRVDQGWGSAQIMGATHYVNGTTTVAGVRVFDEEFGFAVGGGVEVNVPFGNGTQFGIQGGYAKGALDYIADGPSGPGNVDAIFDAAGNLDLGDFFSVAGGFSTAFTPTIALAAGAGWVYMDHDINAFDTQNFNVGGFLGWTPVAGFELGVGAEFRYVDVDGAAPAVAGLPGVDGVTSDGSALTTFFRAQRTF